MGPVTYSQKFSYYAIPILFPVIRYYKKRGGLSEPETQEISKSLATPSSVSHILYSLFAPLCTVLDRCQSMAILYA